MEKIETHFLGEDFFFKPINSKRLMGSLGDFEADGKMLPKETSVVYAVSLMIPS